MKIAEIQKAIKCKKEKVNNFGKYKYRSCEDILESIKPFLSDDVILNLSDSIVNIEGRFYVKAKATFVDSDGKETYSEGWAREETEKKGMDESQVTGSSSSYARKYALCGLFLIDDGVDSDLTNQGEDNKKGTPKEVLKPQQQVQRVTAYEAKKVITDYIMNQTELVNQEKITNWLIGECNVTGLEEIQDKDWCNLYNVLKKAKKI